jgi:hypothetical protein
LFPDLGASSAPVATSSVAFFGKIMFSYQLLDTLLWACSWPDHERLTFIPRSTMGDIPTKIEQILANLGDWDATISKAKLVRSRQLNTIVGPEETMGSPSRRFVQTQMLYLVQI